MTVTRTSPARRTGGDKLTPLELGAWREFLRAHAVLTRELDEELRRAHGLPLSSYDVLVNLESAADRQMRMSELADAVLLSRSGLTRLVDRLVALGYVRRNACADDGRGSYAELTAAGREKFEAARRTHLQGVREFFLDRLTQDDQRALGETWDRVLG